MRRVQLTAGAVEHEKARAALGLPRQLVHQRTRRPQQQPARVDRQRELGEHDVALGHADAVDVARPRHRDRADQPAGPRAGRQREDPVAAAQTHVHDITDELVASVVVVGVGGEQVPADAVVPLHESFGVEGRGVELDWERRLGQGEVALPEASHVDVRVVVDRARVKQRRDTLEERAAGVVAEADVVDAALARLAVAVGVEKAAAVADSAVGEGEHVEHRKPVEEVPGGLAADLIQGRRGANQRAGQPARDRAVHVQVVERKLLLHRAKAETARRGCRWVSAVDCRHRERLSGSAFPNGSK